MSTKKNSIGSKSPKKISISNKSLKKISMGSKSPKKISTGSKSSKNKSVNTSKKNIIRNTTVDLSKTDIGTTKKIIRRSKSMDILSTNNESTKKIIIDNNKTVEKDTSSDNKNKSIKKLTASSTPAISEDPCKKIKLGGKNGGYALVSEKDYDELSKYSWHKNKNGYVKGNVNGKTTQMHRFILKLNDNDVVDHVNRNRSDNRKSNLRIATRQQNSQNLSKRKNTLSKYKGVLYDVKRKKFMVHFMIRSKIIYLGSYINEEEAADVYDMFLVHNSEDEFRELNFPKKKSEYLKREYIPFVSKKTNTFYGVSKIKNGYRVQTSISGEYKYIGISNDPITGAKMYDKYIMLHNIPNKKLNFPLEHSEYDPKIIKTTYEIIDNKTIRLICDNNLKDNKVLIDMKDYDSVKYFILGISQGYVYSKINNKRIQLSRFLLDVTDPKIYVDHINSDPLDNRRSNLRLSNASKNARNKKKMANTSSNYIGVSLVNKKWRSFMSYDGTFIHIGMDKKEKNAAKRRDIYILDHYPDEHYKLNFENWTKPEIIKWKKKLNIELKFSEKNADAFADIHQHLENGDFQHIKLIKKSIQKMETDCYEKESEILGN
jgi:hypothetical protein